VKGVNMIAFFDTGINTMRIPSNSATISNGAIIAGKTETDKPKGWEINVGNV
jgi:hypothetical protein